MTLGAIVLARLDSSRLPGKGLIDVSGRPILAYTIERLRQVSVLDRIILATSDRSLDDALVTFAVASGIECFRGSADDVAGRVLECAQAFNLDAFVRVNGDSPLIDYDIIADAIRRYIEINADVVTNVFPRSFPIGASVEIVRTVAMKRAYVAITQKGHFEHVTKFFYDNPELFSITNVDSGDPSLTSINLAVDLIEDLERFRNLILAMSDGHLAYTGQRLYSLYRRLFMEEKCPK
jgi:spore coat polysaccharide biosynthesis protein SpsF